MEQWKQSSKEFFIWFFTFFSKMNWETLSFISFYFLFHDKNVLPVLLIQLGTKLTELAKLKNWNEFNRWKGIKSAERLDAFWVLFVIVYSYSCEYFAHWSESTHIMRFTLIEMVFIWRHACRIFFLLFLPRILYRLLPNSYFDFKHFRLTFKCFMSNVLIIFLLCSLTADSA